MERSIWTPKTMELSSDLPGCLHLWNGLPDIKNYGVNDLDFEKYVGIDLDTDIYICTPYHERPIRRSVVNGTPISTLLEVLDFSKILDKNFWSRVKLDCCQDSILCTSRYMEISSICTFGFINFRVYELSGIWIFGLINLWIFGFKWPYLAEAIKESRRIGNRWLTVIKSCRDWVPNQNIGGRLEEIRVEKNNGEMG